MRNFTENQPLLTNVKTNNLEEIKRILLDNIFFLQGNQTEIQRAVEFTISNSDFRFDEHIELEVSNKNNKSDYFSDEQWNMDENYSRERYNLLVSLYNETFAKEEYTSHSNSPSKNETARKAIIGGAIIIAGYFIYKALL